MRVLIPYGTSEGLTARISEYVADVIRGHGHEAEAVDLEGSVEPEPDDYDAVIVGASIHMGKHKDYVLDFVRKNRDELGRLPSAFFSVSIAAHDNMEEAEGYIEKFVRETGWRPLKVGLFGGALLYTHYGFIKRHLMKKIVRDKGNPDTDTSRDYVYTEWDGVKRFVEEFLEAPFA
jgi:menaquinone-dependent protoporphyrinogen oxidase